MSMSCGAQGLDPCGAGLAPGLQESRKDCKSLFWETTYFLLIINVRQHFKKSVEETLQAISGGGGPGAGRELCGVWRKKMGEIDSCVLLEFCRTQVRPR